MRGKTIPIATGDLIRIRTTGGGGWGDPAGRDPDAVRRDRAEGKVSAEAARAVYGLEA